MANPGKRSGPVPTASKDKGFREFPLSLDQWEGVLAFLMNQVDQLNRDIDRILQAKNDLKARRLPAPSIEGQVKYWQTARGYIQGLIGQIGTMLAKNSRTNQEG